MVGILGTFLFAFCSLLLHVLLALCPVWLTSGDFKLIVTDVPITMPETAHIFVFHGYFELLAFSCWSFIEKTSVMQDSLKMTNCMSYVRFALNSDGPQQRHLMDKIGTYLGQVGLRSDVPPSRCIWWPRALLHKVIITLVYSLGQADIQSGVPPW